MKKLQKGIDFIIFKEGKNKTVEFALDKNIKLVNPLFIHESELKGELQTWEQFEIKKSYTELIRNSKMNSTKNNDCVETIYTKNESENKKRKFDQAFPNLLRNEESISKKIKNNYSNIKSSEFIYNKQSHENTKLETEKKSASTIKNQEMNKSENKITNFFRPSAKSEIKSNQDIKNIFFENPILDNIQTVENCAESCNNSNSDLIKISSISIGEEGKFKINNCVKSMGKYIYVGESLENISQSKFVVVNDTFNKNDFKYIYCLFYNKKIISLNFFIDSKNQNQYKFYLEHLNSFHKSSNINEEGQEEKKLYNFYVKDFPINFKSLEEKKITKDFPFKEDRYKIYLHPSLYEKELIKKEVYVKILEFLGLEIENNIRLSDICILNKQDLNEHFPGHVRLINESFLFDCLFNWKVMNIENMKYFPEKIKVKN